MSMRSYRLPSFALSALVAAAVALAGCGEEAGPQRPVPAAANLDPAASPVRIGSAEDLERGAALGVVLAARISESGEHVVVLDFVPPYVKVFTRDGRLRASFLDQGGGPGEVKQPSALALSGDSLILVGDAAQRLLEFDMDGNLRRQARIPEFPALSAASGCGPEWVIYGPKRPLGSASWLHRVRFVGPDSLETSDLYVDSLARKGVGTGLAYGAVSDRSGVLVHHSLGAEGRLLRVRCGTPEVEVSSVGGGMRDPALERKDGGFRSTIEPGSHFLAGIAAVRDGVVVGEGIVPGPDGAERTQLRLVRAAEEKTILLEGSYVLRDSKPELGILMSTSDPVPQVFLVSEEALLHLFSGG